MLRLVRRPLVALAAAALTLCGCGGGPSDAAQVRAAVLAFSRATAAKDYRRLCDDLLAPRLVEQVKAAGLPCEDALQKGLGRVEDPKLTIGRITVDGDTARADVRTSARGQAPSRDTLKLTKVGGRWRIASLG
jgi:ketosteroid isomerase-like protein